MIESVDVGVYCFVKGGIKIIKQYKIDGIWYSIKCPEKFNHKCIKCRYWKGTETFIFRWTG
jgi:hypothetical protein